VPPVSEAPSEAAPIIKNVRSSVRVALSLDPKLHSLFRERFAGIARKRGGYIGKRVLPGIRLFLAENMTVVTILAGRSMVLDLRV